MATLLILPVAAAAVWWVNAGANATLQRLVFADSTGVVREIAVHPDEWDGRSTPVQRTRGTTMRSFAASTEFAPAISPDGRSVAWVQDSSDSTTLDIWIRTPSGTRRLTREARDDLVTSWLPDGSAIIGMTNRWSPANNGNYDIAVFDTATGAARQITHGSPHDGMPFVSPDGTRIAFNREPGDAPPQLCVTTFDGTREPECRLVGGQMVGQLLGWVSPVELALIVTDGSARPLVLYDWSRNATSELVASSAFRGVLSPDRRWIVAALNRDGIRGIRDWVVPLEHPNRARVVDAADGSTRWWEGVADRSALITRIEFTDSTRTIPFGIGTRLHVRPLTAGSGEVPLYAPVTWRSSDTLVAMVDSTGEIRPRSSGVVTITASLAGWRETQRELRVRGEPSRTVAEERWNASWTARWLPWGNPAPSVESGPEGIRGFANNGDGTYPSMAYSRRAWSAREGLGVEMRLSTPFTRTNWQRLRAALVAGIDTSALTLADKHKAPPPLDLSGAICGMTFPQEGDWGAARLSTIGGGGSAQVLDLGATAASLRGGAWWTLRLQIFPDGRCGVALNGHVIWMSAESMPLSGDFRVRLGDESNGTTLLHGPLEIWTGVRTDVDWSRRSAGHR